MEADNSQLTLQFPNTSVIPTELLNKVRGLRPASYRVRGMRIASYNSNLVMF